MTFSQPHAGTIWLSLGLSHMLMGLMRLDIEMIDKQLFEHIASLKEVRCGGFGSAYSNGVVTTKNGKKSSCRNFGG